MSFSINQFKAAARWWLSNEREEQSMRAMRHARILMEAAEQSSPGQGRQGLRLLAEIEFADALTKPPGKPRMDDATFENAVEAFADAIFQEAGVEANSPINAGSVDISKRDVTAIRLRTDYGPGEFLSRVIRRAEVLPMFFPHLDEPEPRLLRLPSKRSMIIHVDGRIEIEGGRGFVSYEGGPVHSGPEAAPG